MNPTTYNKPEPQQGSLFHGQVIAPAVGSACNEMDWHKYLTYCPEDGTLIWKQRDFSGQPHPNLRWGWNKKFAGKKAGIIDNQGYLSIRIWAVHYGGHRIIWEMHYGPIPAGMQIDHINRQRADNRLENLRLATHGQNTMNCGARKTNSSGYKGVYRRKNRWIASIQANNSRKYLGSFKTKEEAYDAYCKKADEVHMEFSDANPVNPPKKKR